MLAVLQRIYRAAMEVLTSAELLHKLGNKQVSFPSIIKGQLELD